MNPAHDPALNPALSTAPEPSRRRFLGACGATALGLGLASLPGSASAARRTFIHVPLSQDGTDQSARIQAAIDQAPDGAKIILPAGRYRVDRRINITGRNRLFITGPSDTDRFRAYSDLTGFDVEDISRDGKYSYRSHWQISRSTGIKLQWLDVSGPNTLRDGLFTAYREAFAFEHAYSVVGGSTMIRILSCSFRDVHGDGVYVGGTGDPCRDVGVLGVTGNFPGRQSMGITNVDGLVVKDVTILGGGRSGVDIEPNHASHYVRNAHLERVTMGSKFYPFVIGGSIDAVRRENITLVDCTAAMSSSAHPAILASRNGFNVTVLRHRDLRQGSPYGMIFGSWSGVSVDGCVVSTGRNTPTSSGVRLVNCSGPLTLTNNQFVGQIEGFDQLFEASGTTDAASIVRRGNVWAMGTQRD